MHIYEPQLYELKSSYEETGDGGSWQAYIIIRLLDQQQKELFNRHNDEQNPINKTRLVQQISEASRLRIDFEKYRAVLKAAGQWLPQP